MFHCKKKQPHACIQFDAAKPEALNEFLLANGGNEATFRDNGTADILTMVKGNPRFVYLFPGSWLISFGPCKFTALSKKVFEETFDLVD